MASLGPFSNDHSRPLFIHIKPREYTNPESISNLIRYITRSGNHINRRNELIAHGSPSGCPCFRSPEEIISEFEFISQRYHPRKSWVVHYVVQISDVVFNTMGNSIDRLICCMVECCQYIFDILKHQCYFGIHYSEPGRLHAHIVINATNYCSGLELHQYPVEMKKKIEIPLAQIFEKYMRPVSVPLNSEIINCTV